MSILMVNEKTDFKTLKKTLGVSDGNLASHTQALEKAGYITIKKSFVGKIPNTTYFATESGKKAFKEHLDALEEIIKKTDINDS
ncbi:MAG: transcriptional regulator [Marinilabiliales bacterium]